MNSMTRSTRSRRARAGAPAIAGPDRAARLLARLYGSANLALRTRLVACLLRPLGSLGVAAVAAGAFTVVLSRRGAGGLGVAMADVAEFSKDQVAELARFVEQVSPEALQQAAGLVLDNSIGVGAFTASVALLLALELRRASTGARPPPAARSGGRRVAARDRGEQAPRVLLLRRSRICSTLACSTTSPSFITSTSSAMKRTTARSWLMKM